MCEHAQKVLKRHFYSKKQSLYPLGIVSELSGLLSCDTGCGMRVGVILIYIFRYIVLYASQWSTTIINTE